MKNLIVAGKEINLVNQDNKVWISTLDIAKVFNKEHKAILRIIRERIAEDKEFNDDISWYLNINNMSAKLHPVKKPHGAKLHRVEDVYILGNGAEIKKHYYIVDRDIFNDLTLGFQGKEARRYKRQFIKAFNAMEKELLNRDVHVEELEHVKKAQLDLSTYGTLSKANKLHARTKQVKSYVRSDKNNPLSVLLGQKARLTQKLNGLFDDEIKKELERLEVKIEMVADSLYQEIKNLNKRIGGK